MFWLNTMQQLVIGPHQFPGRDAADVADYMVDRFVAKFPIMGADMAKPEAPVGDPHYG
jgi:hypothetical protein